VAPLQPFLAIQPINAFGIDEPALPPQQDPDPAITVTRSRLGNLADPTTQEGLQVATWPVMVTGTISLHNFTSTPDADTIAGSPSTNPGDMQASELFSNHLLEHFLFQAQVRDQFA